MLILIGLTVCTPGNNACLKLLIIGDRVRQIRACLNKATVSAVKRGNVDSTRANKRTHLNNYYRFCETFEFQPFPASDWRYCQFAKFLADKGKAPGTIDNYVSSVRTVHRLIGYAAPVPKQTHFRLISDHIAKNNVKPLKQAEPMTEAALHILYDQVNFDNELEGVAWTAVLVGFQGLFRGSNIGPETRAKFDPDKNFLRSDLYVKDGVLTCAVRWSKTIQYRNKIVEVPMIPNKNKRICPEHFLKKMLIIIPALPTEPLFLVRVGNNRYPLTAGQVARLLKKWTEMAGLDSSKFTTHCLRRGGLNRAHEAQLPPDDLQVMGDWKSDAYKRYIKNEFNHRVRVATQVADFHAQQHRY